MRFIVACIFCFAFLLTGCTPAAPTVKPSAVHQQPNGERELRDSLSHTKPQPHHK